MGRSTVSSIVKETCEVIWLILQPLEMAEPKCEQWIGIAQKYYEKTQFPNCIDYIV